MVTFVETRRFTKIVADYLNEDEYALLQRADDIALDVLRRIREEIDG
jgi:hypothetical protein